MTQVLLFKIQYFDMIYNKHLAVVGVGLKKVSYRQVLRPPVRPPLLLTQSLACHFLKFKIAFKRLILILGEENDQWWGPLKPKPKTTTTSCSTSTGSAKFSILCPYLPFSILLSFLIRKSFVHFYSIIYILVLNKFHWRMHWK